VKVLVCDGMAKEGMDILKAAKGIEIVVKDKLPPEELKKIIPEYEAITIRSATKMTKEVIDTASKLKAIGRAGIGLDNVDIEAASKKGVVVMNTPGGNTITTAEHTIALMFSLARKIPQATSSMKGGKWEKGKFMGMELFNKTLGVIGTGNIGSIVVERAIALKMQVIAYDPYISTGEARRMGIELVQLDDLLKRADIITVHVPMTKETRGIIGREAFEKMKNGVIIINCARGGIVDEKALHDAIVSKKVAGAALDVFEKEPPGENPLLGLEQVICTPHLGASTEEAQINVSIAISEQIIDYLLKGVIRNGVNVPSLSPESYSVLKPYLVLAERMGGFQSQLQPGAIEDVTVEYCGDVANYEVAPITIAALKGLLTPALGEDVNFVNAPIIARERGIKVVEVKTLEHEDFASLIILKIKRDVGQNIIAGALFGKEEGRIVRIDDFPLETSPEGCMLVLSNWDKPGVIGSIGTFLGSKGINIAGMQLGRDKPAGKAISLLHIDQQVSETFLKEILSLPNIISAKQVVI